MEELLWRIGRKVRTSLYMTTHRYRFGNWGRHVSVVSPLRVSGKRNIFIGSNVKIEYKTWLVAKPIAIDEKVELIIGDGCVIGHFNHIYATKSVVIEKNVLTADKVYISDNQHGYDDVNQPILKQPVKQCKSVKIGEGSWLGENVCVMGATIGKHCVIGANSVVINDIPDFSVAVGSPARVVKKYNFVYRQWVKNE